ncbi:MAG: hypothetical protein H7Y27_10825 [Gemmatimonadaceae bacterium]|nr:hypothetical protein [Chitinophagaceae bacterium]
MKRVLPILGVSVFAIVLLAACSGKGSEQQSVSTLSIDTSGVAEFAAWKKQQEFAAQYELYKADKEKSAVARPARTVAKRSVVKTGNMSTTSSYPAKTVEKKKGWSSAAKGAAIGGVSGAVLGGVLVKNNRVLGAVIGGVAGAGAGYGIGRSIDKKNGR